MTLSNLTTNSVHDTIDGQPIVAPQLGLTSRQWQNGYGINSDGRDTNRHHPATRHFTKNANSLIIYFSRSGSTELLAAKIAARTNADLLEIVTSDHYPANYQATLSRANYERENQDFPTLKMAVPDLTQYDTIYLGYPIWAMTLAHPMTSFLLTYGRQLTGKRIIPFMSEGGYGQGDSVDRIGQLLSAQGVRVQLDRHVLVVDGNKVDRADNQINRWLATK